MYFAISLSAIGERKGLYLRISTDAESPDNAISFFGSAGEPYFAILSGINEGLNLKLLESESAWIVFENLEAKSVITNGNISGLEFSPERIALQISNGKPEYLEVKRTNFPGWEAYVDGVPVKLDGGLFLAINVPQGEHFVEFIYNPRTFLFGVLISFFTIFGLMIYFLINCKDDLNRSKYKEKIVRFQGASSKISWTTHTSIICLSIVLAAVIYFALISFLNLRFTIPETTAINWYTLNNYPRQQDYFYFLTAFVFIFSASILFWFIFLWYKNKK